MKPLLGCSFSRSWYMRLFHTPRTSFLLTTRLWKHNSCSVLFLFQERTLERPLGLFWILLCISVHKSTTWNQNIDEKFQWLLLADYSARIWLLLLLYFLAVGDVREYCVLCNHCHIRILDVSHDLLNGFVSGLPFSSPPPPPPSKISSPLAP